MGATSIRWAAAILAALVLQVANPVHARELVVFAAASLREALGEVSDVFAERGHPRPVISFAASSVLARQIEHGAPADLFVSADEQWMDYLSTRSLIVAGTRTALLGNDLVLIAPVSRPFTIEIRSGFELAEALGSEKLAMADVENVPAGRYGKAALAALGVWPSVEGSVVRQADVRSALALVERDEARAGIVYRTDATATSKVMIAGEFPSLSHQPIVYPLAIVAGRDGDEVRALREFLLSQDALAIFRRHGFSTGR